MKNTIKVLGIIALIAIICFSFAACDGNGTGTSPETNPDSNPSHSHTWGAWTVTMPIRSITTIQGTRTCTDASCAET